VALRAGDGAAGGGSAGARNVVSGAVEGLAGGAVGVRSPSGGHESAVLPGAVAEAAAGGRPGLLGGSRELAGAQEGALAR